METWPMLMRSWWILALRGVITAVFGVLALAMPGITLLSLVALFAVYALLAGAVSVVGAIRNRNASSDWWLLLLMGAVSLAAGVLAAWQPALALLTVVLLIGVNALVTGVLDIILAIRMRKQLHGGEWVLVLSAVASIIFGVIVVALPEAGALALVWLFGAYALLAGLLYLALAYRACKHQQDQELAGQFGRDTPQHERRVRERRMSPAGH